MGSLRTTTGVVPVDDTVQGSPNIQKKVTHTRAVLGSHLIQIKTALLQQLECGPFVGFVWNRSNSVLDIFGCVAQ